MATVEWNERVAVITGAASGLGRALAFELLYRGCNLSLLDINPIRLDLLKNDLPITSKRVSLHVVDIANEEEVIAIVAKIELEHNRVDILINNAGISISQPFEEMTTVDFDRLINVNFWGTVFCTKHFLPLLRKHERTWLINVISDFALLGFPGKTAYAASKAALMGLTNSLRTELAETGICVSLVFPPPMNTGLVKDGGHTSEEKRAIEVDFVNRHGVPVDLAAKRILSKALKCKYRIVIGTMMFWLDLFSRMFPTLAHYIVGRLRRKITFY